MNKNTHFFLSALLLFCSLFSSAQQNKADSLLSLLKKLNSGTSPELMPTIEGGLNGLPLDTVRINTLNALAWELRNSNPDTAITLTKEALEFSEKAKWKIGIADANSKLGVFNWLKGNYSASLAFHFEGLKLSEELSDKTGIARSLGNIGLVYRKQGDYPKALDYYFKALKMDEELGNKDGIARHIGNIGVVYFHQGDCPKALGYYFRALKMDEELGNKDGIARHIGNIGIIYCEQGDYPKALDYYFRALKINEELGNRNKSGIARNLGNIGSVYEKQAESQRSSDSAAYRERIYNKALDYYFKALKMDEELGNKSGIATDLGNIGSLYTKTGRFKEAEGYLKRSLAIADTIGSLQATKEFNQALAHLYDTTGRVKLAFEHYKKYILAKDSLFNEENTKKLVRSEMNFEFEKKQAAEKAGQEKQKAIAKVEIEKQKLQRNTLIIGLAMLLFLLFFIYRSYRQKQRANTALEALNKKLEQLSIVASETDNGVLICGPKGEIEWINAGVTRLLGYTLEDIKKQGNTLEEISANDEIKALIHQSIENKKPSVYQSQNKAKDGTKKWMQSTLTPILDEAGNIKKLVVIDTDITGRKIAEDEVKRTNEKIIDSITYAQLIQQSILIEESEIQKHLPDSFIFYKPKDIVSGDFYWFSVLNNKIIIAAIDCTGHGVPGAFMSMIGNTLLNQIVNEKQITTPSEILRLLNQGIFTALHQGKEGALSDDGMDVALCCIDYANNRIEYAGAQNPLYIISDNELEVIKADARSVGGSTFISKKKDFLKTEYTNHIIPIKKGMNLYLSSDGYFDQFGGNERKRFGTRKFKELLSNNQQLHIQEQKELVIAAHEEWKGNTAQTDDILVIGVKL